MSLFLKKSEFPLKNQNFIIIQLVPSSGREDGEHVNPVSYETAYIQPPRVPINIFFLFKCHLIDNLTVISMMCYTAAIWHFNQKLFSFATNSLLFCWHPLALFTLTEFCRARAFWNEKKIITIVAKWRK